MGVGERERNRAKRTKTSECGGYRCKAWCQTADRIRISEQKIKDRRIWIIQEYE